MSAPIKPARQTNKPARRNHQKDIGYIRAFFGPVDAGPDTGMHPIRQLRIALAILVLLVFVGSIGYSLLWHVSLLDGLYMTVITLATVGFRELREPSPTVKAFTIVLILIGVVALTWAVRAATELAVSEQIRELLGKRQLENKIARMKDHVIICGFGRMGLQIAADLTRAGRQFIVIDPNPEAIERNRAFNFPLISEDASSEAVLQRAGVECARDLVTVAPTDADNIFIVLTARGLAPHLHIVARSTRVENEGKIYRAGADRVVSPYTMGGMRMAAAIIQPHSLDFMDLVMGSGETDLEFSGVEIVPTSRLAGMPLGELDLPHHYGLTLIAMRRDGIFGLAPDPDTIIVPGDILMVIGPTALVEALRTL